MSVKMEKQKLRKLLSDAIPMLCKNGLPVTASFCIEAMIGITVLGSEKSDSDTGDVVLVCFKQTVSSSGSAVMQPYGCSDEPDSAVCETSGRSGLDGRNVKRDLTADVPESRPPLDPNIRVKQSSSPVPPSYNEECINLTEQDYADEEDYAEDGEEYDEAGLNELYDEAYQQEGDGEVDLTETGDDGTYENEEYAAAPARKRQRRSAGPRGGAYSTQVVKYEGADETGYGDVKSELPDEYYDEEGELSWSQGGPSSSQGSQRALPKGPRRQPAGGQWPGSSGARSRKPAASASAGARKSAARQSTGIPAGNFQVCSFLLNTSTPC